MRRDTKDYAIGMATVDQTVRVSASELEQRMLGVENAIAQQELEGLTVSSETQEDLLSAARGEISIEQVIKSIHTRLKHDSILRS